MFHQLFLRLAPVIFLFSLSGCEYLDKETQPSVKLINMRVLSSEGFSMRFAIDLAVVNPSSVEIPVDGLAWYLSLEGSEILSGANNQIPTLAPYSETPLSLEATTNLTGMLSLFNKLMTNRENGTFHYQLRTRIGLSGMRLPVTLMDEGSIQFGR